ncbi:hypothetical protein K490DRAFT_63993 [Saccharata proteae CBS 121410]|uniref:Uncharacterized protein n=1 Tax=Saccharata proteae CBS 121410 TaxID=1314787 RepID=A0A6A5YCV9_9PEZI|nr:hypothetical protein K490DRAFT_63993 [Saccharata proteae CBS 121410]
MDRQLTYQTSSILPPVKMNTIIKWSDSTPVAKSPAELTASQNNEKCNIIKEAKAVKDTLESMSADYYDALNRYRRCYEELNKCSDDKTSAGIDDIRAEKDDCLEKMHCLVIFRNWWAVKFDALATRYKELGGGDDLDDRHEPSRSANLDNIDIEFSEELGKAFGEDVQDDDEGDEDVEGVVRNEVQEDHEFEELLGDFGRCDPFT